MTPLPPSLLSAADLVAAVGLTVSALYSLFLLYAARDFTRQKRPPRCAQPPAVSILRPLHGTHPQLEENLDRLCRQDYPRFEIVCGVAREDDPAIAVVRRVQARYPAVALHLVVDSTRHGTNYKVGNLLNMLPTARHEVIVMADSDIRVEPDYLARLVAHLAQPGVGLVTSLYRAAAVRGLPALVESLFINTEFAGMILVARKVETQRYAFGATIALKRTVLDEIGGFAGFVNHLADDYELGRRVTLKGYRVAVCDQVVETVVTVDRWRTLFQHQIRWARTQRFCRPVGYFFTILTQALPWSLYVFLRPGLSLIAPLFAVGVLLLRQGCGKALARHYLGARGSAREFLLGYWLKELLLTITWALAFFGREVVWAGRCFHVGTDATMTEVRPTTPPCASWPPETATAAGKRRPDGQP